MGSCQVGRVPPQLGWGLDTRRRHGRMAAHWLPESVPVPERAGWGSGVQSGLTDQGTGQFCLAQLSGL